MSVAAEFRSAAIFHGDVYVCGSSALFRYHEDALKQTWQLGRELPPYPLHSLAVRSGIGNPELWIATNGGGILVYDGDRFTQILPEPLALRKISSLLPLQNGRVLVGTPNGLYISDGKSLRLFHPAFAKTDVTALAGGEDRFWIGTRNDGAYYWSGGEAAHIAEQLPDPQVLSIATRGSKAWIGTPVGVAEFSESTLARRLADGLFARALVERNGTLWVGTVDQGTVGVPLATRSPHPRLSALVEDPQNATAFLELPDSVGAVSSRQIFDASTGQPIAAAPDGLTSDHITAVHQDSRGRFLWIGYFDRGLDILRPSNRAKPVHLESDVLFCINRIRENPADGTVAVASANGLALFDSDGNLREVLDSHSGLIASHVTDMLFRSAGAGGRSMVIATPAGLSFLEPGGLSSLYAFHGLVNNHVYTVAEQDGILYAGTLGGVSTLKNGIVRASFTTANSALRQNWITASALFDGNLYLGTYGSGVIRFDERGGVTSFPAFAHDRIEISANAMLATSRALYAGTAGRGLAILRGESNRWQFVLDGLPSATVTALDEHGGQLYIGTTNGLTRISENNLLP